MSYRNVCFSLIALLSVGGFAHTAWAVPAVKKSTIEHIPILIPSLAEQKKIAEFIFTVDENISSTYQKLNQMKGYKKGIIQQLFPNKYNL